ncbi:GAF domain-containing protein [Saccharospirillum impatiens]|uniref:GAF domain-containing protein n=1 Tax=Saccharospirillum impatiens TaxID=169438 RepID=UPI00040F2E29|nr:GAF domain-containing protein [Saccharospirillum impatiens]
MQAPDFPDNERERLIALNSLDILDTPAEAPFDRITRLARRTLGVETVLISLIDANRQWFKSRQGLDATETPRTVSFCGHAILGEGLFEIPDALADPRFADNPLVTAESGIRFYAGMPLQSHSGYALGTLCLIDSAPRTLTLAERDLLADLASLAEAELQRREQLEQVQLRATLAELKNSESKRLQTDQALQSRERLLRTIIDNIPMNIYVKDRSGRKLLANRSELAHLGLASEADILGKHDRDLYPAHLIPQSDREDRAVLDKGETLSQMENEGADDQGNPLWYRTSKIPLRNESGDITGLVGLSIDVTEEHDIRQNLRRQLQFLRILNDIAADAKSSLDERLNRALALGCEYLGLEVGIISRIEQDRYTVQWCQAPPTTDLNPGDEFALGDTFCSLVLNNEGELVIQTATGTPFQQHPCYLRFGVKSYVGIRLQVRSTVYGTLNFSASHKKSAPLDETDLAFVRLLGRWIEAALERAQDQRQLQQREARLRVLFDLSPLGISLTDLVSGQFLAVNDALVTQSGYSRVQLLAMNQRHLSSSLSTVIDQQGFRAPDKKEPFGPVEAKVRHRDGHKYPVMVIGLQVLEADGTQLLWTVYQDISDQRRIERLKSELVSSVSHELRTPLTSISGSLKLLEAGHLGELPEPAGKMVSVALKNADRLILLVNDLLDMDKLIAGRMPFDLQPTSVQQLLSTTADNIAGYAQLHKIRVVVDGVPPVKVRVDAHRFEQVMANLLSNAIKFSPQGETVTIGVVASNSSVAITVRDRGPGIPDSFKPQIFQRFSQADNRDSGQKGGTGLGLAISQSIMQTMGGEIGFESEPGLTEFRVVVPRA